jgi:hypothetical protein
VFHSDPGHGWLEVPMALLSRLGLLEKITPYSYRKLGTAYLEEDLDTQVFLDAAKQAGMEISIMEVYDDPTPIRDYPHYTPDRYLAAARGQKPMKVGGHGVR